MVKNVLDFDEFILNEGLLMSYPADKVVRYVHRKLNLTDDDVELYNDGDSEYILVGKHISGENFKEIESILKLGGYYQADSDIDDFYTYEKIFEKEVFKELKAQGIKYLYHVTPSINDKKIQSIGLMPKSKNYRFNYPERIYLLSENDVNNKPEFLENICRELYIPIYFKTMNSLLKKSISREIVNRKRINEYSVYRIDFEKLNNICLYVDPNTRNFDSYFTMDNIKPEYLKKIDEIKL